MYAYTHVFQENEFVFMYGTRCRMSSEKYAKRQNVLQKCKHSLAIIFGLFECLFVALCLVITDNCYDVLLLKRVRI